jgi:hypothetical protein
LNINGFELIKRESVRVCEETRPKYAVNRKLLQI